MGRVIAVQNEQMNMLKNDYNKNVTVKSIPENNADLLNESLSAPVSNPSVTPIDMETQVVNLNPTPSQPSVTTAEATAEVFGTQAVNDFVMPVFPGVAVESQPVVSQEKKEESSSSLVDVPYQEPTLSGGSIPVNVMSDDSYFELLNSLRNMITDFANNAYAAIDKYQEEKLQGKNTGASLIGSTESSNSQENEVVSVMDPVESESVSQSSPINILDNHTADLDQTVVIPGSVLSNAINEVESGMKLAA